MLNEVSSPFLDVELPVDLLKRLEVDRVGHVAEDKAVVHVETAASDKRRCHRGNTRRSEK
eukprot:3173552-Heterocapsa_arctica.AAC.1